jgi:hypothetical protein
MALLFLLFYFATEGAKTRDQKAGEEEKMASCAAGIDLGLV